MPIFLKVSNCRIIIAQTTYSENIQHGKMYFYHGLVLTKTNYNDSVSFFGRYFHFKFQFFSKMPIFLKVSNCRMIIAQITYFENIQYGKIYIQHCIDLTKTSYNDSAFIFWKKVQFSFFF